jgi:hypothetical protein
VTQRRQCCALFVCPYLYAVDFGKVVFQKMMLIQVEDCLRFLHLRLCFQLRLYEQFTRARHEDVAIDPNLILLKVQQ